MDQFEPQEGINMHKGQLAKLYQQGRRERQQKDAGEEDFDRVELGQQQATARQQCQRGRKTVVVAAAQHASDAIAHQNMLQNQNANEAIVQRAAKQNSIMCNVRLKQQRFKINIGNWM